MDFTQIITTIIVALFSGSGLVAVLINNSRMKRTDQLEVLNKISKSVELLATERAKDQQKVDEIAIKVDSLYKKMNTLKLELNDLTMQSLRVNRAMTNAVSVIIQALEDGHINGEGKEAKIILDTINDELFEFQEKLITNTRGDGL